MYVSEDNDEILVQERLISLGIANPTGDEFSPPTCVSPLIVRDKIDFKI